ncbi:phosphatidylethanolamine N-methyltransferase [Ascosphaera acerosa]|nr:phosphatidylethanolamine N-methyltransferase [Ascosphaera acerosa]
MAKTKEGLQGLTFKRQNQELLRVPKNARISKRPIPHAPPANPFAGSSAAKIVYVSSRTPFMSAVKRVQKLLRHAEARATARIQLGKQVSEQERLKQLARAGDLLAQQPVYVKATGRAIEKVVNIGKWFGERSEYTVTTKTGSVLVVDDIVEVQAADGQDSQSELQQQQTTMGKAQQQQKNNGGSKKRKLAVDEDGELLESRTRYVNSIKLTIEQNPPSGRHIVRRVFSSARPKFSAGVTTLVKDTSSLFQRYPARITLSRLEADVAGYDPKDYSLHASLAEGPQPAGCSDASIVDYGAPIKVRWSAPLNHSKMDWVGLYCVTDNTSREVTRVSSKGHWIPTNPGQYDSIIADAGVVTSDVLMAGRDRRDGESSDFYSGEMIFSGEKLYWKQGVFEFRYHHNGKHNVMAISRPFEIRLDRFSAQSTDASPGTSPLSVPLMSGSGEVGRGGDTGMQRAIESVLFPVVRKCLDSDPGIAPENAEDAFTGHVLKEDKYARRIVYAVQEL